MSRSPAAASQVGMNAADRRADGRTPVVTNRSLIHQGRRFGFELLTVQQPSGKQAQREIVRHPGAVVVVPVLDDARIVLIRNFRISVEERLWECCAGTLEAGEDPAVCAGRELIEETGYRAHKIQSLGWFYTTPGLTDEKMHAFVATGLTHVGQDLEEDENIEVELVPAAAALGMIERGELRDGKSMAAILLAERRGLLAPTGHGGGR